MNAVVFVVVVEACLIYMYMYVFAEREGHVEIVCAQNT